MIRRHPGHPLYAEHPLVRRARATAPQHRRALTSATPRHLLSPGAWLTVPGAAPLSDYYRYEALGAQLGDVGISFKRPKWLKKLTIKKVIKPLAVAAAVTGAMFIPGVAPAVATVAKGIFTGGKFVATKTAGLFKGLLTAKPKLPTKALQQAAQGGEAPTTAATQTVSVSVPGAAPTDMTAAPSGTVTQPGIEYGGGAAAPTPAEQTMEQAAGAGEISPAMIGVGGVALLALLMLSQRKR